MVYVRWVSPSGWDGRREGNVAMFFITARRSARAIPRALPRSNFFCVNWAGNHKRHGESRDRGCGRTGRRWCGPEWHWHGMDCGMPTANLPFYHNLVSCSPSQP